MLTGSCVQTSGKELRVRRRDCEIDFGLGSSVDLCRPGSAEKALCIYVPAAGSMQPTGRTRSERAIASVTDGHLPLTAKAPTARNLKQKNRKSKQPTKKTLTAHSPLQSIVT